jgi:antitoxin component YwqK of YwqJK toxin-antitoxin module
MMEVAGSGEMYYQVPTVDGVVEATIQKLDNSGNVLTVEVYNNGNLIKSGTTRTPEGEVDIHADLKAAQSVAANQTTGM